MPPVRVLQEMYDKHFLNAGFKSFQQLTWRDKWKIAEGKDNEYFHSELLILCHNGQDLLVAIKATTNWRIVPANLLIKECILLTG